MTGWDWFAAAVVAISFGLLIAVVAMGLSWPGSWVVLACAFVGGGCGAVLLLWRPDVDDEPAESRDEHVEEAS